MKTITDNQRMLNQVRREANNKLIAEFMGLTIITDGISLFDTNFQSLKKYNSDWNWLMEVVEKIESLGGAVCIGNGNCVMIVFYIGGVMDESYSKTRELTGEVKIEAVYNAVIEFIKWYNQQNK